MWILNETNGWVTFTSFTTGKKLSNDGGSLKLAEADGPSEQWQVVTVHVDWEDKRSILVSSTLTALVHLLTLNPFAGIESAAKL